jgi:phage repressor protein C with HTH and peptisase S24 domain
MELSALRCRKSAIRLFWLGFAGNFMADWSDDDDGTVPETNRAVTERAERLREAVKLAGGTSAVAARIGMHVGTLNRYMAGRDMKAENMIALARGTGVRLEWLATGQGGMTDQAPVPAVLAAGLDPNAVAVDRYDVRASAGPRTLSSEGHAIERIYLNADWLRQTVGRVPDRLSMITARGDSMEPTIHNGDTLLVEEAEGEIVSGKLYVLDVEGELLVKRITRRLNGGLLVQSDNKAYPPEEVGPRDKVNFRIVGQVVWHARWL